MFHFDSNALLLDTEELFNITAHGATSSSKQAQRGGDCRSRYVSRSNHTRPNGEEQRLRRYRITRQAVAECMLQNGVNEEGDGYHLIDSMQWTRADESLE